MKPGALGKFYQKGDIIIREGESGDCMYVIQEGTVEVFQERSGKEVHLAYLTEGDFFGEMAIFEQEERSASVRTMEDTRILTIDQKSFLKRIHEDPSLAFHIVQILSNRIRLMDTKHSRIRASDRRNWDSRPEKYNKSQ